MNHHRLQRLKVSLLSLMIFLAAFLAAFAAFNCSLNALMAAFEAASLFNVVFASLFCCLKSLQVSFGGGFGPHHVLDTIPFDTVTTPSLHIGFGPTALEAPPLYPSHLLAPVAPHVSKEPHLNEAQSSTQSSGQYSLPKPFKSALSWPTHVINPFVL